ncbi:helix-turn-helix domain-containing protein [Phyllobacterium pellucidum]|uniref:helix-turn-helix domain-containing protein n=1 Tax=Phyllobacterium pellucidum TaxID=2740464 RepID=UPI001D14BB02|nr:helix-turn-helix domain-containing protein [Phyllobacterium sp. T1018]UGY08594.1 helix-turn-helix domain-containing protein [Phyllobacterium sp. T1018]
MPDNDNQKRKEFQVYKARILKCAMFDPKLNGTDCRVLFILGEFANSVTRECFPSHEAIADKCAMKPEGVRSAMRRLRNEGYLQSRTVMRPFGKGKRNYYTFHLPECDARDAKDATEPTADHRCENTGGASDHRCENTTTTGAKTHTTTGVKTTNNLSKESEPIRKEPIRKENREQRLCSSSARDEKQEAAAQERKNKKAERARLRHRQNKAKRLNDIYSRINRLPPRVASKYVIALRAFVVAYTEACPDRAAVTMDNWRAWQWQAVVKVATETDIETALAFVAHGGCKAANKAKAPNIDVPLKGMKRKDDAKSTNPLAHTQHFYSRYSDAVTPVQKRPPTWARDLDETATQH